MKSKQISSGSGHRHVTRPSSSSDQVEEATEERKCENVIFDLPDWLGSGLNVHQGAVKKTMMVLPMRPDFQAWMSLNVPERSDMKAMQ